MSFQKLTSALLLALFAFASFGSAQNMRGAANSATQCTDPNRFNEMCMLVVSPVCGYKPDVVCVGLPCNYVTYSNSCEACRDPDVVSYTNGKCTEVVPPPLLPPTGGSGDSSSGSN